MAYMDAHALAASHSTPVLTTHLWLATLVYPCFGVALFGLIRAGQRERSLGSRWIGWIGMVGAVAHGIVMVLVHSLEIGAVPGAHGAASPGEVRSAIVSRWKA